MIIGMTVLALGSAVTAARATGGDVLPLPGFGDLAVDDARERVFVSGGRSSNSVVVVDEHGRVKKKIDNQFGASGLVLSEDARTLYVAQAAGDAISAIDTTTFAETARYPTGARTCPAHLARTGTVVWFGYGCEDEWNGGVGRLDPAAATPVTLDEQGDVLFQGAPLVTSAGTTVVAGQLTTSLSGVHVYRAEAGGLTPGASGDAPGGNLTDVALSPDGTGMYTAAGSRTQVQGFATEDLSGRGSYSTGPYPNAVAPSPNTTHVATGAYTTRSKAITIFPVGGTVATRSYDLGGAVPADRGLAWSADSQRLYAVLQGTTDPRPRLEVFSRPLS
ncbi:hypothetical protein [Lentzea albida]|uniref:40-residue YVTN family beta-propeller repeat-containing protein n=1 Tax=Lentzea albida TaxID=65499 RepID=A0A1H9TNG3_9PSEU|nr:hypothetical protein [Lentzea albida]SER98661.1 hypothetical protein SAMN04488000_11499 [Lentzea albida]